MQAVNTKNQCFVVWSDEIEGRIDPHFYKPEFTLLKNDLQKTDCKLLSDIISFSSEVWNQKDIFQKEFPYIEISEIDTLTGTIKNIIYYDKNKAPSRAKMIVREGDIIVSTTRPNRGAISFIDKAKDGFIASTGFAVLRDLKTKKINKKYLFYFLRTNLALNQMLQRSSGGNYPAITTEELQKLIISIPPLQIQNQIVEIMESAYKEKAEKEAEAEKLLNSIDDYVLDELGIKMPEIESKLCFVVSSDEVGNRLNSYYHQPKFKELENVLEKGKYKPTEINQKLKIITELEDISKYDSIKYIDLASINKDLGIVENYKELKSSEAPSRAKQKVSRGDLLLSSLQGSLKSIAIVEDNFDNIIASTGFYIIKKSENYNNYYLWAIFRNSIYQILLDRTATGAIMSAINKNDLEKLKIPFPPLQIQNQIANEVKNRIEKAKKLKEEAKNIVENAKKEVEKIILSK